MEYVITYAGCPVLWRIRLQTEISLSTTETEYISIRQAMREVIPFIALMKEVSFIFDIHLPNQEVFVKYSRTIKFVLLSRSPPNSHQKQKLLLLSTIISKDLHKRRLFGYSILIHNNK